VTKVYWALDGSLAYARHYPAIHWLNSYSLYQDEVDQYNREQFNPEYPELRKLSMEILQKEAKLQEIIRIVGMDSLSNEERVLLETAKALREDYLQQNAFDDVDTFSSKPKQLAMLRAILGYYKAALGFCERNPERLITEVLELPLKNELAGMKYIPESEVSKIEALPGQFSSAIRALELDDQEEAGSGEKPSLHGSISHLDSTKVGEES